MSRRRRVRHNNNSSIFQDGWGVTPPAGGVGPPRGQIEPRSRPQRIEIAQRPGGGHAAAVHTPSLARLRSCWALHPHLPPRLQVSTWQPSCVSHAGGARRREPTPSHRVESAWPWIIWCYGLHGMARAAHAKHTIVIISNNSPKNFLLRALRARSYTPPGCNLSENNQAALSAPLG